MASIKQNSSLLEPVEHITESRPFSFHHTKVPPCTEVVLYLHWHSEVEFLYIEQGETIFYVENNEYHLRAGDAVFIPPNLLHMAKGVKGSGCEFRAIVFSSYFLLDFYTNSYYGKYMLPIMHNSLLCPLHLMPAITWHKSIINNLISIFTFSAEDLEKQELQMHGMLLIIWQLLYNNHLSKIGLPKNFFKINTQLEAAISYIQNSYSEEITLRYLSNLCNMSEGQFCRLFKQLTGFTPFSYIHRYRVLKSCDYLTSSTKKIAEIATLCGFNNLSYYNREFAKIMKTTPSAYRKAVQ